MSDKKPKFITKQVSYGGREITMFSIDGLTWSTRKSELQLIQERQEREKVSFSQEKEEEEEQKTDGEAKVAPAVERAIEDEALNERFEDAEYEEISRENKPVVVDFLQDIPMLRMSLRPKEKTKAVKLSKKEKAAEREQKRKEAQALKAAEKAKAKEAKAKEKAAKAAAAARSANLKKAAAKKKALKVAPKKRASSKPKKAVSKSKRKKRA